jgi:hypothetical protein
VRHSAKRRRIKTVMQELIYCAARLIEHGRRIILGLGANDRAATVLMRMHAQLAATPSRGRQAGLDPAKVHPVPTHPNCRPRHGSPRPYTPELAAMARTAMRITQKHRWTDASRWRFG